MVSFSVTLSLFWLSSITTVKQISVETMDDIAEIAFIDHEGPAMKDPKDEPIRLLAMTCFEFWLNPEPLRIFLSLRGRRYLKAVIGGTFSIFTDPDEWKEWMESYTVEDVLPIWYVEEIGFEVL